MAEQRCMRPWETSSTINVAPADQEVNICARAVEQHDINIGNSTDCDEQTCSLGTYYTVSQKIGLGNLAITLSNLNRFAIFFAIIRMKLVTIFWRIFHSTLNKSYVAVFDNSSVDITAHFVSILMISFHKVQQIHNLRQSEILSI